MIKEIRTLGVWRWLYLRFAYRIVMRTAHRWHWHQAPPHQIGQDVQRWCQWCGFRETRPLPTKPAGQHP